MHKILTKDALTFCDFKLEELKENIEWTKSCLDEELKN